MAIRVIKNEIVDSALTVDGAKTGAGVDCSLASSVLFVTVATSASSPVGTTLQLQGSRDNVNFENIGSATSVTGNGTFSVSIAVPLHVYYRVTYARSSGSYVANTYVVLKGQAL